MILHCFLCCCPFCWCLIILSFLYLNSVTTLLSMSRDRKHMKRNDGYDSDNSYNPGDRRERSDRDVDTPQDFRTDES